MNGMIPAGLEPLAAAGLLALGAGLALRGLWLCRAALPHPAAVMRPLVWMRGFRLTLFGLAVAGVGAAWLWHLPWVLALALAIGGEETLECSIAVAALHAAPGGSGTTGRSARTPSSLTGPARR